MIGHCYFDFGIEWLVMLFMSQENGKEKWNSTYFVKEMIQIIESDEGGRMMGGLKKIMQYSSFKRKRWPR
jgi:hypothetical protein